MIYDIFTLNGEYDLLEIRFNVLSPFVDQFIIVEAPTTFSGKSKPLYWAERDKERFKEWENKVKYHVIDENYTPGEIELAENSPNTIGAAHWKHEFLQKESIKKALTHLEDDDIVFIGDVDEIWHPKILDNWFAVSKLKLKVYSYWLNNRSSEEFWGTIIGCYRDVKDECLNHLRQMPHFRTETDMGWHFTSMGGVDQMRKKLNDSYTQESYNTPFVQDNLEYNMTNGLDFLGRDFKYEIDESEWPNYLKNNREKYKHLLK